MGSFYLRHSQRLSRAHQKMQVALNQPYVATLIATMPSMLLFPLQCFCLWKEGSLDDNDTRYATWRWSLF